MTTCNLRDSINWRLALFVVSFEPEYKSCVGLSTKGLYHEDECKEERLPACQVSEDGLDSVGLALGLPTSL